MGQYPGCNRLNQWQLPNDFALECWQRITIYIPFRSESPLRFISHFEFIFLTFLFMAATKIYTCCQCRALLHYDIIFFPALLDLTKFYEDLLQSVIGRLIKKSVVLKNYPPGFFSESGSGRGIDALTCDFSMFSQKN